MKSSNKKSTVLITGGAGFIGSHTTDLFLSKGFKVKVIDNLSGGNLHNIKHLSNNRNFKFLKADLTKFDKKLSNFLSNVEYVIHFAGIGDIVPSIKYPEKYFENNVQGTVNLLSKLKIDKIKKFVYAASSSCYGIAKTPTTENHMIKPLYPYASSKYLAEEICLHWRKVYNLNFNSIRIFNAYGTRSRTSGAYGAVFGVFLKQIIENKPLTVVGNGKQKRDFLYVTDVANAFYKAAVTNLNGKIWNLGSGKPKSINYLIKLLNKEKDVTYIPERPGEPRVTHANINKITSDLKWSPKVSFETGVNNILENIDYWRNAPLWNKKNISKETELWFKFMKKYS